jgi:hypothetical protein
MAASAFLMRLPISAPSWGYTLIPMLGVMLSSWPATEKGFERTFARSR